MLYVLLMTYLNLNKYKILAMTSPESETIEYVL